MVINHLLTGMILQDDMRFLGKWTQPSFGMLPFGGGSLHSSQEWPHIFSAGQDEMKLIKQISSRFFLGTPFPLFFVSKNWSGQ